jgi:S1-C subfamily serine protease
MNRVKFSFMACACLWYVEIGQVVGAQSPDNLYLATTFIQMFAAETKVGSATGFFYQTPDTNKIFLITNRHVVRNERDLFFPDKLRLRVHVDASDLRQSKTFDIALYSDAEKKQGRWKEITPTIDVVALELPVQHLTTFYVKPVSRAHLLTPGASIAVGEPVVILGYPLGFFDEVHNLPVARQGAVASAFPMPFRGEPFFLVDANLHAGTSGSPVFTRPGNGPLLTSSGDPVFGGRKGPYLIGINSGRYGDLNLNIVWFTSIIEQLVK